MHCEVENSVQECGNGRSWWHWMFSGWCTCGLCWLNTQRYKRKEK